MATLKTVNYKVTEMRANADGSYHVGLQPESPLVPGVFAGQPFTYLQVSAAEAAAFEVANGAPLAFGALFSVPFTTL